MVNIKKIHRAVLAAKNNVLRLYRFYTGRSYKQKFGIWKYYFLQGLLFVFFMLDLFIRQRTYIMAQIYGLNLFHHKIMQTSRYDILHLIKCNNYILIILIVLCSLQYRRDIRIRSSHDSQISILG